MATLICIFWQPSKQNEFPGFLSLLSKNKRSNFIFRVVICNTANSGTSENDNLFKISKMIMVEYTTQILSLGLYETKFTF